MVFSAAILCQAMVSFCGNGQPVSGAAWSPPLALWLCSLFLSWFPVTLPSCPASVSPALVEAYLSL